MNYYPIKVMRIMGLKDSVEKVIELFDAERDDLKKTDSTSSAVFRQEKTVRY